MRTLVLGAGNLLLSDEGFGVHFIDHLARCHCFSDEVRLLDAGTLGIMVTHELEQAERVYIVDVVTGPAKPGEWFRYEKEDFMLRRIPLKLSPHQAGVQEMLLVSEMRGRCPAQITLFGVIPESLAPGATLSPVLEQRLPELADLLISELSAAGQYRGPAHS